MNPNIKYVRETMWWAREALALYFDILTRRQENNIQYVNLTHDVVLVVAVRRQQR